MSNKQLPVSRAEQERMGILRPSTRPSYVDAGRNPQQVQVLPPVQEIRYGLDVAPNATLVTEVRSSKMDGAKAYLVETTGLCFIVALALVLGARYVAAWPLLGAGMYLSTLILFAVLWGGSYIVHKFLSAEGVSFYESWRKWNVIDAERRDRAAYYRRLSDQSRDGE